MKKHLWIGIFVTGCALFASAETAESIIRQMEYNQVQETARIEGRMTIHDRFGDRVVTFISYAEGEENSLIEFTSRDEEGQKILRTEDEIYLYFPEAEELIRIQGSALRDGVMGSDMSYEDLTGGKGLLDSYEVELDGESDIDGSACYAILLTATARNVPYPSQRLWVDQELFVYRRIEQYSRSGDLLKSIEITDFIEEGDRIIPTFFHIEDEMRRGTWTEFEIEDIEVDLRLDPYLFSLEELTW